MSTATRKERWREARRGIRHWSIVVLIVFSFVLAGLEWVRRLPWLLEWPVMALQVGFIIGMVMHPRELCEKCIAMMPLDPERAIKRERPLLWLHHSIVIRSMLLLASVLIDVFTKPHSLVSNVNNSVFDVWMALVLFSLLRHSRLEPWCPRCHGGGGGGGAFEEAPDPTDDHSKPLPV